MPGQPQNHIFREMPLSDPELRRILVTGVFAELIGEFEGERLESKGQPYRLETDDQRMELAKDVSGLANRNGGAILLGCVTETDSAHGDERITVVRPRWMARRQ